jgi:hypothetical protein
MIKNNQDQDRQLQELANDFMSFLYGGKPKRKRLRPLTKRLTYNGVTIKWTEDGRGNFLDFVGSHKYDYYVGRLNEDESIRDYVKRLIDEGAFK